MKKFSLIVLVICLVSLPLFAGIKLNVGTGLFLSHVSVAYEKDQFEAGLNLTTMFPNGYFLNDWEEDREAGIDITPAYIIGLGLGYLQLGAIEGFASYDVIKSPRFDIDLQGRLAYSRLPNIFGGTDYLHIGLACFGTRLEYNFKNLKDGLFIEAEIPLIGFVNSGNTKQFISIFNKESFGSALLIAGYFARLGYTHSF